jgi:hypothetical protein
MTGTIKHQVLMHVNGEPEFASRRLGAYWQQGEVDNGPRQVVSGMLHSP